MISIIAELFDTSIDNLMGYAKACVAFCKENRLITTPGSQCALDANYLFYLERNKEIGGVKL